MGGNGAKREKRAANPSTFPRFFKDIKISNHKVLHHHHVMHLLSCWVVWYLTCSLLRQWLRKGEKTWAFYSVAFRDHKRSHYGKTMGTKNGSHVCHRPLMIKVVITQPLWLAVILKKMRQMPRQIAFLLESTIFQGEMNMLGASLSMVNCETRSVSCWHVQGVKWDCKSQHRFPRGFDLHALANQNDLRPVKQERGRAKYRSIPRAWK